MQSKLQAAFGLVAVLLCTVCVTLHKTHAAQSGLIKQQTLMHLQSVFLIFSLLAVTVVLDRLQL